LPEKGKKSLPINEETHRLLKREAAELGVFVTELVDEMWRIYCERKGSGSLPSIKSPPLFGGHRREHELLDTILQSDAELAQTAKRTLKALAELAAARAAAAKQTKAG
jgi:hypothetical protein